MSTDSPPLKIPMPTAQSRIQTAEVSYHSKKCFCMQFSVISSFYTSFFACFQTGTFGIINHFWKYFIFLLAPSFPHCYAQHYKSHSFKQLLSYLKDMWVWHMGTWFSGLGTAGEIIGLDLGGLFQSKWSCDSSIIFLKQCDLLKFWG